VSDTTPGGRIFAHDMLVRFSHCDPAGIVYYPWFFDMTHATKEDWFSQGLGYPHSDLMLKRRMGTPTVRIDGEFFKPVQMGDTLRYELKVLRMGNSSIDISISGRKDGVEHLRISQTLVFMSLESRRPVPIPEDLRPRIAEYLVGAQSARDEEFVTKKS
jgi:4-hydroxybenzoyl-CoA thioesterase